MREQEPCAWSGAVALLIGQCGSGTWRVLLQVLAGRAPAAPATNPEIPVLEAMAAKHCLQSHSGMSVLPAYSGPYIPLLRPRGFWEVAVSHIKCTGFSLNTYSVSYKEKHKSNSSMDTLIWMQQPCWAQLTCTTHSGLVQTFVYTETRAHSQWSEMKLCIQVPEPIFTFKFVSKNHMHISIYKHYAENILHPQSYVQTSSSKKDHSCFICASLLNVGFTTFVSSPSDSALLFSQGISPGFPWWYCCPDLKWSLELYALHPKLHLSTQRPSPALWSVCSYLPSREKWIAYRNFSSFFPIFILVYYLFHI